MTLLIENRQKKIKVALRELRQSVNSILRELGCRDMELSLLLVDNEAITEINRQYLNRNHPTNVIAFSQREGDFGDLNPHLLGDVIISVERASSDAEAGNLSLMDELVYLSLHGILHLLGYEHEGCESREAERMKDKSNELFFKLKGYLIE